MVWLVPFACANIPHDRGRHTELTCPRADIATAPLASYIAQNSAFSANLTVRSFRKMDLRLGSHKHVTDHPLRAPNPPLEVNNRVRTALPSRHVPDLGRLVSVRANARPRGRLLQPRCVVLPRLLKDWR